MVSKLDMPYLSFDITHSHFSRVISSLRICDITKDDCMRSTRVMTLLDFSFTFQKQIRMKKPRKSSRKGMLNSASVYLIVFLANFPERISPASPRNVKQDLDRGKLHMLFPESLRICDIMKDKLHGFEADHVTSFI